MKPGLNVFPVQSLFLPVSLARIELALMVWETSGFRCYSCLEQQPQVLLSHFRE